MAAKKKAKRPSRKRPTKKSAAKRSKKSPPKRRPATKKAGDHRALRQHLLDMLRGGGAHAGFEKTLASLPVEMRGAKVPGLPFTPWRLLEHMRIAQWDILEFSLSAEHVSPEFSAGYWPETDAPPHGAAWEQSLQSFRSDMKRMEDLVADPKTDLFARIPHGDGQTILREGLVLADHNAYHLGQLVLIRRLLGAWSD